MNEHKLLPRVSLATLILLSFPGALASSVTVDAQLDVHGTATFTGEANLTGTLRGALLDSTFGGGGGSLHAKVADGAYQLWDFAYVQYVQQDDHPMGGANWQVDLQPTVAEDGTLNGRIDTGPVEQVHSIRVRPLQSQGVGLAPRGELQIERYVGDPRQYYGAMFTPQTLLRRDVLPPEGAPLSITDADIQGQGETFFFIYGANVTIEGEDGSRTVQTGERPDDAARVGHPDAMTQATLIHRFVLVIDVQDAMWRITSPYTDGWQLLFTKLAGEWRGDLALTQSQGEGHVNGTSLPEYQHLFQVIGEVKVESRLDLSPSKWHVVGEATFVGVDGLTVAGERPRSMGAELAAAAGIGFLALVSLYFTKYGQWLLAWVVGRNETTLTKSKTRVSMLRLICERPGVSTGELARRVGITRQGARLQVMRLQAFHAIDSYRRGRVEHHVPNSNTYRYLPGSVVRRNGDEHERIDTRPLFAALGQPTRRAIFRQLAAATGPLDYNRAAREWDPRSGPVPSRRLFNHHAKCLVEVGLLDAKRRGRVIEYAVAVNLEAVFPLQAAKFLDAHRALQAAYRAIEGGSAAMDEALGTLRSEGFSRNRALQAIDELHAFGFIDRRGDSLQLNRRGVFAHVAPRHGNA